MFAAAAGSSSRAGEQGWKAGLDGRRVDAVVAGAINCGNRTGSGLWDAGPFLVSVNSAVEDFPHSGQHQPAPASLEIF